MPIDRARYERHRKETDDGTGAKRMPAIMQLMHAVPPMERLTSNNDWNKYLSVVQAWLEQVKGERKLLIESLADSSTVEYEHIMRHKLQISMADGCIKAWEQAMSLPVQIVENKKSVDELLAKLKV